jgi:3-oxoacyl-[acyl-carrier-protein] synthase-3
MSSMVNYQDRNTCPIFGDGAGCVLMEATTEDLGLMDGVYHVEQDFDHLHMAAGGSARMPSHETVDQHLHCVYQEGRAVFKHAVTKMADAVETVAKRNGLTNDSIQWFVPHQANLRIIEAVGARLNIDEKKVLVNIQQRGNTSAASIPLCLDENKHRLHKGDKMVLTAFGAGFTWGALYLIWSL